MKIREFQGLAVKTKASLGSQILDSVHMVLGLCSELCGELPLAVINDDAVNVREEIGDAQWYVAGYADTWGIELPDEIKIIEEGEVDDLMVTLGELQDLDKKQLAYGKIGSIEDRTSLIISLLISLEYLAYGFDIDTDEMRALIIAKLKARYGEKFSAESANTRNLDVERAILEGK